MVRTGKVHAEVRGRGDGRGEGCRQPPFGGTQPRGLGALNQAGSQGTHQALAFGRSPTNHSYEWVSPAGSGPSCAQPSPRQPECHQHAAVPHMPHQGCPLCPLLLCSPTYLGAALQEFCHPLQGTSAGGHYSVGLLLHHAPEKAGRRQARPEGRGQGMRQGQTGGGRKRRGRAQAQGPYTGTEEPGLEKEGEYTVRVRHLLPTAATPDLQTSCIRTVVRAPGPAGSAPAPVEALHEPSVWKGPWGSARQKPGGNRWPHRYPWTTGVEIPARSAGP